LWLADTRVAFETGLNTAVRKLPRALGESADDARFVQTVPGVGYRFIATVVSIAEPSAIDVRAIVRVPRSSTPTPGIVSTPAARHLGALLAILLTVIG